VERFVCLAYHQVTGDRTSSRDPLAVTPASLRAQMGWLSKLGYMGVSLSTAIGASATELVRSVALTFDDGYLDFYTTAWPILQQFGFGATVFVVTEAVGKVAGWGGAPAAQLMSWNHLQELADANVEIGVHGLTHCPLDVATSLEVRREVTTSCHRLSRMLGGLPTCIAYPYGRWSAKAAAISRSAGLRWGCTTRGGINTSSRSPFKLRRSLVQSQTGRLGFAIQAWTGYARLAEWRMDMRGIP
jgi:peptidoglycan/xylan/chitin deacetylase (PgdA/CDA1 family)